MQNIDVAVEAISRNGSDPNHFFVAFITANIYQSLTGNRHRYLPSKRSSKITEKPLPCSHGRIKMHENATKMCKNAQKCVKTHVSAITCINTHKMFKNARKRHKNVRKQTEIFTKNAQNARKTHRNATLSYFNYKT
jgi:hypothetical protein